jgi:dTDP-4-amino-4,6-dideoxygalactose transaminase
MNVPQFNLSRVVGRIEDDLWSRWRRLVGDTSFVGGSEVAAFESDYSDYLGAVGCVGVANGTDALELAMRALELAPGDEVIVPAYSFVATATAVILAGGRPVLVDVERGTLNIDVARATESIGDRTVGIIAVHLYGRPCDLPGLSQLCESRGLWLIEDAAQAHGARTGDRRVGTFGELATWSFYPSKNLGCFGDGGAVTSWDEGLLARVRSLSNHGRDDHFTHGEPGRNSRLDALQAAVLNARLPLLDADNERRRAIAAIYRGQLEGHADIRFLDDLESDECVFHQMTLLHPRRDDLREHLAAAGVGTAIHYPLALHQQDALASASDGVEAPVAEEAARQVLCLPMFPELKDDEVAYVCEQVLSFGS